jgi:hypothetical protein
MYSVGAPNGMCQKVAIATLCTVLYGSRSASICVERAANIRKMRIPKCLHIIRKGGEAGIVVAFVYMRVFTYVHGYLEHVLYQ